MIGRSIPLILSGVPCLSHWNVQTRSDGVALFSSFLQNSLGVNLIHIESSHFLCVICHAMTVSSAQGLSELLYAQTAAVTVKATLSNPDWQGCFHSDLPQ